MKEGDRVFPEKLHVHAEGSEEAAAVVAKNSPKIWKFICILLCIIWLGLIMIHFSSYIFISDTTVSVFLNIT